MYFHNNQMTNHKTLDAYTEVYDFAHFKAGLLFSNIPQSDISYYLINARKFSPEFGEVTVATLLIIKRTSLYRGMLFSIRHVN